MYVCCMCIILGAFSFGVDASEVLIIDDTSSSVTEVADSSSGDARDDPDGGEEDDLPFPVQSAGHTSPTAVCGCGC